MPTADLTTVANVKDWTEIANTKDDGLLARLIRASSGAVMVYLNRRNLLTATYTESYPGNNSDRLVLPNYPVVSVSALSISGQAIQKSPDRIQPGYFVDSDGFSVGLAQTYYVNTVYSSIPYKFYRGSVVDITYTAGYQVTAQDVVPSDDAEPHSLTPLLGGTAMVDLGVVYSDTGQALAPVATAPSAGQYAFASGTYTFASGDGGAGVSMTYSYVPHEIEQVVIESVARYYWRRRRQDKKSEGLAQQATTYDLSAFNESQKAVLGNYRRIIPA